MTHSEIRELKERHAELTKWVRQAQSYSERYGQDGSLEAREKHASRLAQAEREIPRIEAALKLAWST